MASPAGTLSCPHCGAPAESGRSRCAYCRGELATVRCAACFRLSSPDALCCGGCGRTLGLEPIGLDQPLACPRCGAQCDAFHGSPGTLHECGGCAGQFVELELLRELLERREVLGGLALRHPPPRPNPLNDPVKYLPCPCCRDLMNRKNFGRSSGVVVDVCSRHGTWFDAGELSRVLAFVESGGLARARLATKHASGPHEPTRTAPVAPRSERDPVPAQGDPFTDIGDAVIALVALIASIVD
jgi:Zn-finger nucleic acid-binding protein